MASSQIMRSLLRQEHADVIKFLTRLLRTWKKPSFKRNDGLVVLPLSENLVQLGEVLASAMYFQCDLAWPSLSTSAPPKSPAVEHINLLGAEALSLWVGSCRNLGWGHEASQRQCRHENSSKFSALSADQDRLHLAPRWWDVNQKPPEPLNAQLCP